MFYLRFTQHPNISGIRVIVDYCYSAFIFNKQNIQEQFMKGSLHKGCSKSSQFTLITQN